MERTDNGPEDGHLIVNGDADPEINIGDLQAIANNYSAHIQGYQVWRGHWNGTGTDWEGTFRPNVQNPTNTAFSDDRTASPPASIRPMYSYSDDLTSAPDTQNVRYKVVPFGDAQPGVESNEAVMPPPGSAFTVSGTVTASGIGLPGVTMTLTPGGYSAITHPDGTYSIIAVPNGSYTLTPTKGGYTFALPSQPVTVSGADVTGQDFIGTALVYSVSGTVTQSGVGLAGVTMTLSPGGQSATTQGDGTYAIANVWEGNYTLAPSKPGYVFSPPGRSITVSAANISGQDFSALPLHSISGTVTESGVGLAGVLMTLTPGGLNATTQANGTYTIPGVVNGSYTLRPSRFGYSFSPLTRTVNVSGANVTAQDFTATWVGTGLANTPWPKFRGNAKNTGLSPYVGAQTSHVKWSYATGAAVRSSPAIGVDGAVYVGSADHYMYALNAPDGSLKWRFQTGGVIDTAPAVSADGTVYVWSGGPGDDTLYALDNMNGSCKWAYPTGAGAGEQASSPTIAENGTVYLGCPGTVSAIAPSDGAEVWKRATDQIRRSSIAIGADGTLFVGTQSQYVYAIRPGDGSVKWRYLPGVYDGILGCDFSSPAIGADGTLYMGSADGNVYALNPANGNARWIYSSEEVLERSSLAIGLDGTLYIESSAGSVYALSSLDGQIKWTSKIGGFPQYSRSSPAVGADGTIYVGADSGFFALSPSDGSVKWSYTTCGAVSSSPAIGADGTVYIGSNDGKVYAFGP